MLDRMKHSLESRLQGEISKPQICRWHHPYGKKQRGTKEPLKFSHSIVPYPLWPHELWHTSLPCPLPTPGACSNSCTWMVMPSNHLILCSPVLLLPSIFCSIKIFSNESILPNRWLKYWNFKFNIRHSSEYSELISFRINLKSLLMKMKEESEKAGLKLNIQKLRS